MSDTLLVLGSTGATGSLAVKHALDRGLRVRAFARSPNKIPEQTRNHPELEVFQGDFTDLDSVARSVVGVTGIIVMAGNPKVSRLRPVMRPLVGQLVESMRTHAVKRLVYQAGAVSPAPGYAQPLILRIVRPIYGAASGQSGMFRDNDRVIDFLTREISDLDWTITRPGILKQGPSRGALHGAKKPGPPMSFTDLAAFTVATVLSDQHVRDCPFLSY